MNKGRAIENQTTSSVGTSIVTREDVIQGKAKVGDIVAVGNDSSRQFNVATITELSKEKGRKIRYESGDSKGKEQYLIPAYISNKPIERLLLHGPHLVTRDELLEAFQTDKREKINHKLTIIETLEKEISNGKQKQVYVLVEILSSGGDNSAMRIFSRDKKGGISGSTKPLHFDVRELGTHGTTIPDVIDRSASNVPQNPTYDLLKND